MVLGNYQFLNYKSEATDNSLHKIIVDSKNIKENQLIELTTICEAVYMARDLVNEPLNKLNANNLATAFASMGKKSGFKVKVFNKAKISELKMGGLLAVNKGSIDPPTFTVMEWKPSNAVNKKPIVFVGKGVVYDTGGLSLKPTPGSMDYMKSDMAGAAAVGCVMYAIAKQKLPVHVVALVPATDNRPDGNAYVPGDVITMMSGLKVEVLNTDAEGRMILADALHYAKRYTPDLVMEFSTLTGAAANAIGHYGIVCMGDVDSQVKKELNDSANQVYERLAEFPFWEEYDELIKSDIADMKNIGGAIAGAITAGRFLQRFVDYPYMHFDIAGPSFGKSNDSYRGKNGTGVGVRFMFDFVKRKSVKKK
jgi:leucyl aminopeptidase